MGRGRGLVKIRPIVGKGKEGSAQRVGVSDTGRIGVFGGLLCSGLFDRAHCAGNPLAIPGLPVHRLGFEIFRDIARDVRVSARIAGLCAIGSNRIVDIKRGLLPCVDYHLFIGVVWMQCRHYPLDWIVK